MRYPPDQKEKTREAILDAAARVFRRQGYEGGGVDAVMKEAGLTHGGFYSHFPNKEALLADSTLNALTTMRAQHETWAEGQEGESWVRAFLAGYLSPAHRCHAERGCVAPALVSELARSGEKPRQSFEHGLVGWAETLEQHLMGLPEEERHEASLGVIAACVGALAVSRAVADPELADRVLSSTRIMVEQAFLEGCGNETAASQDCAKLEDEPAKRIES